MADPDIPQAILRVQSALDPGGPHADVIAHLSWIMFIGAAVIFALVMALSACALWVPVPLRRWLAARQIVLYGGIAFPVVVLTALLVYGLLLARTLVADPATAPLTIHVVGEQFWWRVRYEAGGDRRRIETANEIHIPTGRPVRFILTTADVIHSFWVPGLGGKLDMIPGQENSIVLQADKAGLYRGQCAEFCGAAHALMAFHVIAHEPAAFEDWFKDQKKEVADPVIPFLAEGKRLFLEAGCGACHAVRGTPADGALGPDLTHVGSRRWIAAGTLPNNQGTLAGWIASSQHLKPNNKMPSFPVFTGPELRAIAAYLDSLR